MKFKRKELQKKLESGNENEKCLFSNTQEFLHNILVTWYK